MCFYIGKIPKKAELVFLKPTFDDHRSPKCHKNFINVRGRINEKSRKRIDKENGQLYR